MRGREEEQGAFLGPSRSQKKRVAEAVFELAEQLVALSASQLGHVPLSELVRTAVDDTRRITAHIARKRQLQFLAKQMRREDDESLEAIRRALTHDRAEAKRETAALHKIEAWRDRLLDGGDETLAELVAAHPSLDRKHLRQLIRNARDERLANRPPQSFREIFQLLKSVMVESSGAS